MNNNALDDPTKLIKIIDASVEGLVEAVNNALEGGIIQFNVEAPLYEKEQLNDLINFMVKIMLIRMEKCLKTLNEEEECLISEEVPDVTH